MSFEDYPDIDSKELIRMALVEEDGGKYNDYLRTVHLRGEREIFELASTMCKSEKSVERATGVDVLSQLMKKKKKKDKFGYHEYWKPYRKETLDIYYKMLETEESPDVLAALLSGLGFMQESDDSRNIEKITKFKSHADSQVRFGLAMALQCHKDGLSISTLIELMDDPNDNVRDWSTFGIGSQIEVDTPEIRDALWKRINDKHGDTRWEAINGLAERKDERVFELIMKRIEEGDPGILVFDAAIALADQRFIRPLKKLLRSVEDMEGLDGYWLNYLKGAIEKLEEPE